MEFIGSSVSMKQGFVRMPWMLAGVVSGNWLVFRRQGFSPPARRERRAHPPAVHEERATTRQAKKKGGAEEFSCRRARFVSGRGRGTKPPHGRDRKSKLPPPARKRAAPGG